MQAQQKKPKAATSRRRDKVSDANGVRIAANSYCLTNYAVGYTGGIPRRLLLRQFAVWIVPVVFTSPGYGAVGEVGVVAVDAETKEVVGATPREEVKAAGALLAREKRDELDAAFHRARML